MSQRDHERVADLLAHRIAEDYGVDGTEEDVADFLLTHCSLPESQALALAHGDETVLDKTELDALAACFALSPDLLAVLLAPVSDEMAQHVLRDVTGVGSNETGLQLNVDGCETCAELYQAVMTIDNSDDLETLREIAFQALGHLVFRPDLSESEVEGNRFIDELLTQGEATVGDLTFAGLMGVMSELPDEAQARVLAYAYQELAHTTQDTDAAQFAAYADLRNSRLSPLAKAMCDTLAQSVDGTLPLTSVAHQLGVEEATVMRAVQEVRVTFQHAGLVAEPPLCFQEQEATVALAKPACVAWRAMLQAEAHLTQD